MNAARRAIIHTSSDDSPEDGAGATAHRRADHVPAAQIGLGLTPPLTPAPTPPPPAAAVSPVQPPPPVLSPPPPPQVSPQQAGVRRVEQAATLVALLMQATLWASTASALTTLQHAHQATIVGVQLCCLVLAFCVPHCVWWTYRIPCITVMRILMASVPSFRSTGEGLAVLLDRPPTPGAAGALLDYVRIGSGTRVLVMALAGMVLHQPPLAVLVQQVAMMALTSNSPAYCCCRLLASPLSRRRIAGLTSMVDLISVLIPPAPIQTTSLAMSTPAGSIEQCATLLLLHQMVLGVLLPTLLAAYTQRKNLPGAQQEEEEGGQEEEGAGAGLRAWAGAAVGRAAKLCGKLDAGLRYLCLLPGWEPPQRFLSLLLMLGNLWLVARVAASDTHAPAAAAAAAAPAQPKGACAEVRSSCPWPAC